MEMQAAEQVQEQVQAEPQEQAQQEQEVVQEVVQELRQDHRGLFIAFEGLDGSGNSTQAGLLKDYLETSGLKVLLTKEPTNNLVGGLIRGVLTKDWKISSAGLQLLFCADRAHHLEKEILPALEKGYVVICDRYMFSSMAFGAVNGDMEWLKIINKNFLVPDVTFIMNVPAVKCIERIGKARFDFELFEEQQKLERVMENYKKLAQDYKNVLMIEGDKDRELILKDIVRQVEPFLKEFFVSVE